MKDKNKQSDYESMSLEELTYEVNEIIDYLENHENIESENDKYLNLLKLNNLIEKKFKNNSRNINQKTIEKILDITSKKNANQNK